MSLTRHDVREKAMQSLFSLALNPSLSVEEAIAFAMNYAKNDQDATTIDTDVLSLVQQVLNGQQAYDQTIEKYLHQWTIHRLAKLDLIIMRIAICEMRGEEVPGVVAVHEAIKLAEQFTDDKSRRFINAVLANILKEESK